MIRKLPSNKMGRSDLGWLKSLFHFSFADYYNSYNMNFGALRVINDDLIDAGTGFGMHPHRDMEIVSYIIDGAMTHGDSMGNQKTVSRGQVQYMSAGTGVMHSEHNLGEETLRLLQIWIMPDAKGHEPRYSDYHFPWEDRVNRWLHIVSGMDGEALVKIHQDANIHVSEVDKGRTMDYPVEDGRQAYMVLIEGKALVNGEALEARDALETVEESLHITAEEKSHIMVIEMKKP